MSYNIAMTMKGKKHSTETLQKMREAALLRIERIGKPKSGFKKGHQIFLGKTHTPEVRERIRQSKIGDRNPMYGKTGALSPNWKGGAVGYWGIHDWVNAQLGQPSICENCETTLPARYEWANISGEYKRDTSDWVRLCKRCHNNFDGVNVLEQKGSF